MADAVGTGEEVREIAKLVEELESRASMIGRALTLGLEGESFAFFLFNFGERGHLAYVSNMADLPSHVSLFVESVKGGHDG